MKQSEAMRLANELDAALLRLSEALAELAARHDIQGSPTDRRCMFEDAASLSTPPAQPAQQEPVAWLVEFENGEQELHFDKQSVGETQAPLYTTPPAAQPEFEFECPRCGHCCPQRQWVGLTHEERSEIGRKHYAQTLPLMYAVEDKLKQKNIG
jgi:hypothetical protein